MNFQDRINEIINSQEELLKNYKPPEIPQINYDIASIAGQIELPEINYEDTAAYQIEQNFSQVLDNNAKIIELLEKQNDELKSANEKLKKNYEEKAREANEAAEEATKAKRERIINYVINAVAIIVAILAWVKPL